MGHYIHTDDHGVATNQSGYYQVQLADDDRILISRTYYAKSKEHHEGFVWTRKK
ncbi:MAG: hypothetical protein KDB96_07215 [Flavobacteriales bacterium]|nr:hypothetical protein [Flavobacteriales bacterium]